jgi:hypothetical protein
MADEAIVIEAEEDEIEALLAGLIAITAYVKEAQQVIDAVLVASVPD